MKRLRCAKALLKIEKKGSCMVGPDHAGSPPLTGSSCLAILGPASWAPRMQGLHGRSRPWTGPGSGAEYAGPTRYSGGYEVPTGSFSSFIAKLDSVSYKSTFASPTLPLYNYTFDKGRLKSLVIWSLKKYGEAKTIHLLENLKTTGFYYATKAGISLGVEDLKIPPKKALLLYEAEEITKKATDQYTRSLITGVERYQCLINTWHRTSEQLKQEVIDYFESTDVLNPVYMMAFSGARGNISQVRQLVGMRGLMSDPKGQIIDYPIRSNFREGLTITEYIISSYGARKGIVDTALRTANAGYLTRRLVDVAQHVVISNYDCGTKKGVFLNDIKEGNKTIFSLQTRLLGRVLARNLWEPQVSINAAPSQNQGQGQGQSAPLVDSTLIANQALLGRRNQVIDPILAAKIPKYYKKVFVRSPLTCETKKLICQLCYGWSLAQGNLVSIGEAVGIVAAQSIGEPGTQLTMRTFHTGGAFSGDISDQIIAPYNGIVNYGDSIIGSLTRTPEGKIAFLTKADGTIVVSKLVAPMSRLNKQIFTETASLPPQTKTFQIPAYTLLYFKAGDSVLEKQVIAQISTSARQSSQREDASLVVKSQMQGQLVLQNLQVQEQWSGVKGKEFTLTNVTSNNGAVPTTPEGQNKKGNPDGRFNPILMSKHMAAWDWGYAWILSCNIYKNPIYSHTEKISFIPMIGDFVDKGTIMSKIQWVLPQHGGFSTSFMGYPNTNLLSINRSSKSTLTGSNNPLSAKSKMQSHGRLAQACANQLAPAWSATRMQGHTKANIFNKVILKKNLLSLDIESVIYNKIGYFLTAFNSSPSLEKDINTNSLNRISNPGRGSVVLSGHVQDSGPSMQDHSRGTHFGEMNHKVNVDKTILFLPTNLNNIGTEMSLFLKEKQTSIKNRNTKLAGELTISAQNFQKIFNYHTPDAYPLANNTSDYNQFKLNVDKYAIKVFAIGMKNLTQLQTSCFKSFQSKEPFKVRLISQQLVVHPNCSKLTIPKSYLNSTNYFALYLSTRSWFVNTVGIQTRSFAKQKLSQKGSLVKIQGKSHLVGLTLAGSTMHVQTAVNKKTKKKVSQLANLVNVKSDYTLYRSQLIRFAQGPAWPVPGSGPGQGPGTGPCGHFREKVTKRYLKWGSNTLLKALSLNGIGLKTRSWFDRNNGGLKLPNPFNSTKKKVMSAFDCFEKLSQTKKLTLQKSFSYISSQLFNDSKQIGLSHSVQPLKIKDKVVQICTNLNTLPKVKFSTNNFSNSLKMNNVYSQNKFIQNQVGSGDNASRFKTLVVLSTMQIETMYWYNNKKSNYDDSLPGGQFHNTVKLVPTQIMLPRFSKFAKALQDSERPYSGAEDGGPSQVKDLTWYVNKNPRFVPLDIATVQVPKGKRKAQSKFQESFTQTSSNLTTVNRFVKNTLDYLPTPVDVRSSFVNKCNLRYACNSSLLVQPTIKPYLFDAFFTKGYLKVLKEHFIVNRQQIVGYRNKNQGTQISGLDKFVPALSPQNMPVQQSQVIVYKPNHKNDPLALEKLTGFGSVWQSWSVSKTGSIANKQKPSLNPLSKTPNSTFLFVPEVLNKLVSTKFDKTNTFSKPTATLSRTNMEGVFKYTLSCTTTKTNFNADIAINSESYFNQFMVRNNEEQVNGRNVTHIALPSRPGLMGEGQNLLRPCLALAILGPEDAGPGLGPVRERNEMLAKYSKAGLSLTNLVNQQQNRQIYGQINYYFKQIQFNIKQENNSNILFYGLLKNYHRFQIASALQEEKLNEFSKNEPIANETRLVSEVLAFNLLSKFFLNYLSRSAEAQISSLERRPMHKPGQPVSNTIGKTQRAFVDLAKKTSNFHKFSISKLLILAHFNQPCFELNLIFNPKNYKYGVYTFLSPSATARPLKGGLQKLVQNFQKSTNMLNLANIGINKEKFSTNHLTQYKVSFANLNNSLQSLASTSFLSTYTGEILDNTVYLVQNNLYKTKSLIKLNSKETSSSLSTMKPGPCRELLGFTEYSSLFSVENPLSYIKAQKIKNNQTRCLIITAKDLVGYKINNQIFGLPTAWTGQGTGSLATLQSGLKLVSGGKTNNSPIALVPKTIPQSVLSSISSVKTLQKNWQSYLKKSSSFNLKSAFGVTKKSPNLKVGSYILKGTVLTTNDPDVSKGPASSGPRMQGPTYAEKSQNLATYSGQIIGLNNIKLTMRKAQPLFLSSRTTFHSFHGDFVKNNSNVVTLIYQKLSSGDIVQGIPKVEQFFEARTTKRGRLFRENLPNLLKGLFLKYYFYSWQFLKQVGAASSSSKMPGIKDSRRQSRREVDYTYLAIQWAVQQSFYKIQQIAVDGVLRVYRSQGVSISDKHLEIIVKQMTTKVRIIRGGQTGFFPGELVDLDFVHSLNEVLVKKILYEPVILGITQASLQVDSFLSAASFQQTSRILSQSALVNKKDFLKGVKENVIVGNLIPTGTGYLVSLD